MKESISALGRAFLNLIYPINCSICETRLRENKGLCEDCIAKIDKNRFGQAACQYEGLLKQSIRLFKYKGVHSLSGAFSSLILDFVDRNIDMKKIDTIIPIPLHSAKKRERGFNQAYLLSLPIAKRYNISISTNNLVKTRLTKAQSNLNRTQRLKNLKNAFTVKDAGSLKGKRVLIVDDVYTTGTTVNKAAYALRKAGVSDIKVVALAKGN